MSMQADDAQAHSPSVENAVQHNSGTWWRTQFLLHVEKGAFPNLDGARFVSALLERAAALEKLSPTVAELLAENKKLHACMARRQVASADVAVNQTQNSEQLIHNLRIENTNLRKEIDDGHVALSKLTSLVLASKSNCFVDALEAVPVPVSAPNSTARTTADDVNQAADSKAAEPEQKPAVSTDNEKTLPVVTLPTCRKTPPELKLTASIQKSQKQVPSAKGTSPVSVCPGLQRGDRVLGRFQDGELWYPGTITEVLTGSTFRVQYDDGDVEIFVRAEDVLSLPSRAEAQVSKYGAVSLQRALQLVRRPRSRKSRPRSENSRARSQKSRARSQKSRRRSRKPKSVAEPMSQRFQVWTAKFNLFKDFVSEFGHPKVPKGLDSKRFPKLGHWMSRQRIMCQRGLIAAKKGETPSGRMLSYQQLALLAGLGMHEAAEYHDIRSATFQSAKKRGAPLLNLTRSEGAPAVKRRSKC